LRPSVLASLVLIDVLAGAVPDDKAPSFAELGKEFLKTHGGFAQASDLPLEKLRSDWCVHVGLGGLDLAYPIAALSEKEEVDDFKSLAISLLGMQAKWVDLLAADPAKAQAARADFAELESWVKGWKPAAFANLKPADEKKDRELWKLLSANEAQVQAARRLADLLCKPDVLGVAPRDEEPLKILFAPTRRDFVELVGYAGLLDPERQEELWQPSVAEYTTIWIDYDLVMALQYPPWTPDPEFKTGLAMDKFDKSGLEQHAVQQAANAWQWLCYGDDGATYFHQAVAANLAIAVCGELNALEGDGWGYGTTGAQTAPYERFVPGGNSAGGVLPPMPAAGLDTVKKGHWREGFGKDHFAAPLRKGQKEGQKAAVKLKPDHADPAILEDKNAHFLLISPDETTKAVVSAPFLGAEAQEKAYPPTAVIVDYREFFRAYRSGFFHWLRTGFDPKDPAVSAARFRDLLCKSAEGAGAQPFEEIVQAVYGVPLSGKDGKTDSLEWRFLGWLAKG